MTDEDCDHVGRTPKLGCEPCMRRVLTELGDCAHHLNACVSAIGHLFKTAKGEDGYGDAVQGLAEAHNQALAWAKDVSAKHKAV